MDLGELASIEIKRGNTQLFDLQSLAYDIDDTTAPFISVTSTETGAANLDFLTGVMSLTFEELGRQNVMITVQDSYDKNTYTMAVEVYDSKPFYASKDADTGYMTVDISSAYIGEEAVANMFLTDNAPTFTSITAMWQVCESDTGVCLNQVTYPLDMASAERGWSFDLVFDDVRPFGLQYNDDVKLGNLLATDDTGEEYKLLSPIYWRIMDEAPSPDAMDDDELITHIADLEATIDQLKLDIASSGGDTTAEEAQLETLQADLAEACDDPRADCTSDSVQADGSVDPALSINTDVIIIILGVLILAALLGILFTRRGGPAGQQKWDYNALPSGDAVANSMYGGAQAIFQQPLQAPALPLPQLPALAPPLPTPQPYAGPPLPASGLPPGWTMEQWAYYGQQYLDRLQ